MATFVFPNINFDPPPQRREIHQVQEIRFLFLSRIHEKKGIFVVMEYMNYGSLTSFLHNNSRRLEEKIPLLKDVAEGMAFLHSVCKVLHRDLKSDNCLLVKNPKNIKNCIQKKIKIYILKNV